MTIHRWTPNRKIEVLRSLSSGMLSLKQACTIHGLTEEEIKEWKRKYDKKLERR